MIRQILIGVGFSAYTDLHPWEILRTNLGDNGFDTVVSTGGAISTNTQTAGGQRDIVEQDDDPLGWNVEVRRKLQHRFSGQVHIGLGFQKKQLFAVIGGLAVKSLIFESVNLAAQLVSKQINGSETGIVPCFLVFPAGISQTDDEPAFVSFTEHLL